jgi:hypothetical protein
MKTSYITFSFTPREEKASLCFLSLMLLKETLLAHPFWIQLACAFPLKSTGDCSTVSVRCSSKVSPSKRCVSAANVVCRNIGIFKKDCVLLTYLSYPRSKFVLFHVHLGLRTKVDCRKTVSVGLD